MRLTRCQDSGHQVLSAGYLLGALITIALAMPAAPLQPARADPEADAPPPATQPSAALAQALRHLHEADRQSSVPANITDVGFDQLLRHSTPFMVIPIKGEIGTVVKSEGIEDALAYACDTKVIKDIVFDIDTPGGEVFAADDILEVMQKYRKSLRYHAVIKQAISAGIWVVFGCDDIYIRPGGAVGGAVIFTEDSYGNFNVDAKMNSIKWATMVSTAEMKGYSPILARAMMITKAECYAYKGRDSRVIITDKKPRSVAKSRLIVDDDKTTILTLTAKQADEIGFAHLFDGSIDDLGGPLGIEGWTRANRYGEVSTDSTVLEEASRLVSTKFADVSVQVPDPGLVEASRKFKDLADMIRIGRLNDPERTIHLFDRATGKTLVPSMAQWTRQLAESRRAWGRAAGIMSGLVNSKYVPTAKGLEWMDQLKNWRSRVKEIEVGGYPPPSDP